MRKLKTIELDRLSVEAFKAAEKMPLAVVLDNVRSLYNVGSVFRTADAFRVKTIWLCGITATPPDVQIHKTALGAEESVDWRYAATTEEAVRTLREEGYYIYSVEQVEGSDNLLTLSLPEDRNKFAVILGHEVKGVSQEVVNVSDACIEIPQQGTKHSLNVSVTAGIVMWEFYKRWKGLFG